MCASAGRVSVISSTPRQAARAATTTIDGSNLIGGSNNNMDIDGGKLNCTFINCWWGEGCAERCPRVRFGKVHVRMAKGSDHTVTPALRSRIRKARRESANGETVVCSSPEGMQQYFDSL